MSEYRVAVVGVGLVGEQMVLELKRRRFPMASLKLLARTARDVIIGGDTYHVDAVAPEAFDGIDVAFFAGTEGEKGASATFARDAVDRGAVVIDNGADFRMDPSVPLVVPEVNGGDALRHRGIIANPNCSTIQMVVPLAALRQARQLRSVVVSTYQAVSGAGRGGVVELQGQIEQVAARREPSAGSTFPFPIAGNVIPQIGSFDTDGYCTEESKMLRETRKILHDDALRVYATTVRVPVANGHSESIYVEMDRTLTIGEARDLLAAYPGIRVVDDTSPSALGHTYPMPADAADQAEILVGRVRSDPFGEPTISFWVVADNILKGAATNAVQIAEYLAAKSPALAR